MVLEPAVYWKLAATIERLNGQLSDAQRQYDAAMAKVLSEAGLPPGRYALNDEDLSATLQEPPTKPEPPA